MKHAVRLRIVFEKLSTKLAAVTDYVCAFFPASVDVACRLFRLLS